MSDIFSSGINIFTMKQETSEHNVEYIRRLAKKIKKEQNITHHQALDITAKNRGFSNWKHFLHYAKENNNILPSKDKIAVTTKLIEEKSDPYRNLLVAAINKLLEEKCISLDFEGINELEEKGHVFLNLFEYNSVILWSNRGFGELLISVWWKYDHGKHPQANLKGNEKETFHFTEPLANKNHYRKFVGVVASCWLERKKGKHIQGKNREHISVDYTRKGELEILKELPTQKPKGYEISGPFFF